MSDDFVHDGEISEKTPFKKRKSVGISKKLVENLVKDLEELKESESGKFSTVDADIEKLKQLENTNVCRPPDLTQEENIKEESKRGMKEAIKTITWERIALICIAIIGYFAKLEIESSRADINSLRTQTTINTQKLMEIDKTTQSLSLFGDQIAAIRKEHLSDFSEVRVSIATLLTRNTETDRRFTAIEDSLKRINEKLDKMMVGSKPVGIASQP